MSLAQLATLLPSYGPQSTDLVDQLTPWLAEQGVGQTRTRAPRWWPG